MLSAFVLVHSPLVGPLTWSLVAQLLRRRGIEAIVPSLLCTKGDAGPHWRQHVAAVASSLRHLRDDRAIVLVAHSGAGPLLPAICRETDHAVTGYVFVDASLPGKDGQSRLDLFDVQEAEEFRAAAIDGLIPAVWRSDDLLRALGIEDVGLRHRFAADVPVVPLAVYEEPLPVAPDWPDAPCGYLWLSAPYEADAGRASMRGWPFRKLSGSHLQMLVDPLTVTHTLLELSREIGVA